MKMKRKPPFSRVALEPTKPEWMASSLTSIVMSSKTTKDFTRLIMLTPIGANNYIFTLSRLSNASSH